MAAEIALEINSVRPVRVIKNRIDQLRHLRHRIIFISDMYLPSPIIKIMLVARGIAKPADPIYVSGEIGLTKHSGNLFNYVVEHENISVKQLWHTGDNPYSDVIVPSRLGIKTSYFQQSRLNRYERLMMSHRDPKVTQTSQLVGISRSVRLQLAAGTGDDDLIHVISNVIAPLLVSFVAWVLHDARQQGVDRLYFVSRDGQILLKIAQILAQHMPAPECHYLYGSRQAWFLPTVQHVNRASLDWLMLHSRAPRHLLKKLCLTPEEISNMLIQHHLTDWDSQLNDLGVEKFWRVIEHPTVANLILQRAAEARASILSYLEQEGILDPGKAALVDVGWTLKSQRAISLLLRSLSMSKAISGYYFGVSKKRVSMLDSGRYKAYLLEPTIDGPPWYLPNVVLFRYMGVFEQLFTMADHGSTIGYQQKKHSMEPILADIPPNAQRDRFVSTLHHVIQTFAVEFSKTSLINQYEGLKQITLPTLNEFLLRPTSSEAEIFKWVTIGEDQNETRCHPLVRPLTYMDVVYYLGRVLHLREAREFRAGYAWWEGSIALSSWWIKIVFRLAFKMIEFRRAGGLLKLRSWWWKRTGKEIL